MKPLYFHIGTHRTGTSALQAYLAYNEQRLPEFGYSYLPIGTRGPLGSGRIAQGNGQMLARAYTSKNNPVHLRDLREELLAEFETALADCGDLTPILSGETFCELKPEHFDFLMGRIKSAGFQPIILLWVREQVSYMESRYNQFVKRRMETRTFEAFADIMCRSFDYLYYDSFANKLASMVGRENVIMNLHGRQDICPTINKILNIPNDALQLPAQPANSSLSPIATEILRELNKLRRPQSYALALAYNEALLKKKQSIQPITIVSPEVRQQLTNRFREDTQRLSKNWFKGEEIFKGEIKPFVSQKELFERIDTRELIHFIGGTTVRHEERIAALEKSVYELQNGSENPDPKN